MTVDRTGDSLPLQWPKKKKNLILIFDKSSFPNQPGPQRGHHAPGQRQRPMKQWVLLKAMKSEKQTSPPSHGRAITGKEGMEKEVFPFQNWSGYLASLCGYLAIDYHFVLC